jgi:hypothetical protein
MSSSTLAYYHRQIMVGFGHTAVGIVIVCIFVWIIYQSSKKCYDYAWEVAKKYRYIEEELPSEPSVVCAVCDFRGAFLGKKFVCKTDDAYLVELEQLVNKSVRKIAASTRQSFAVTCTNFQFYNLHFLSKRDNFCIR